MKARLLVVLFLSVLWGCRRTLPPGPAAGADLRVTFFDVGQGDAALLRAGGAAVLIDTGHNGNTAGLLRREGVSRIDLLILSHPHSDHIGGLTAIARSIPVSQTWYAGDYRGAARRALASVGPAEPVWAGKSARLGGLSLTVLHPEPGEAQHRGEEEVNNGSVVVKAEYDSSRYLFPGDCELGCWEELFRLHRGELRADVLKAAHHGSSNGTSSGVLVNVRPRTLVISCGLGNRYGHPHPIVLKLVEKLGARLLRTDEQGTIRCVGVDCAAASAPLP